jgi:hypothetical protein
MIPIETRTPYNKSLPCVFHFTQSQRHALLCTDEEVVTPKGCNVEKKQEKVFSRAGCGVITGKLVVERVIERVSSQNELHELNQRKMWKKLRHG